MELIPKRNIKNEISIIIPVYNEEDNIAKLLDQLTKDSSEKYIKEIIIVDGGSNDNSLKIIDRYEKIKLLTSLKGRAKQMNIGASIASADILYFLHADSLPPIDFDRKIIAEVINANLAGCFRLRFLKDDHFLLKISQWFTRFNFNLFRGGDQSLFINKDLFLELNGFDERYTIFEDCELISRIYRKKNFKIIADYVYTSERRFRDNGVWKLHFNFLMIHIKFWMGLTPEKLHAYYLKNIKN